MMTRSRYSFECLGDVVFVIDAADGGRSVTNDAEQVIGDLRERGVKVDQMLIVYRDTLGIWDQLLVKKGEFAGFRPLGARDREAAVAKARAAW